MHKTFTVPYPCNSTESTSVHSLLRQSNQAKCLEKRGMPKGSPDVLELMRISTLYLQMFVKYHPHWYKTFPNEAYELCMQIQGLAWTGTIYIYA